MEPIERIDIEGLIADYRKVENRSQEQINVLSNNAHDLDAYMRRQGGTLLSALQEDVETWAEGKKWKQNTVAKYLSLLSNFYEYLRSEGCIEENPLADGGIPKQAYAEMVPYTATELRTLMRVMREKAESPGSEADLRRYAAFCLCARCGVGWSEMVTLNIEDYHTGCDPPRVVIAGSRSGNVPLDAETAAALDKYTEYSGKRDVGDPLLASTRHGSGKLEPIKASAISSSMHSVFEECGIEYRQNVLRASVAAAGMGTGATAEEMIALLRGSNNSVMQRRMAQMRRESLLETQDRLASALDSHRPAATAPIRREDLWTALLDMGDCEIADVTIYDDGSVEFGNFR